MSSRSPSALGVVTGVVMLPSFSSGTNQSRFADDAGNDDLLPLLAFLEGLDGRVFLEATFLGVLLVGRKLVPPASCISSAP